jgi:DNA-binding transcriptional regulator YdaS (Cro superfamily)
MTKADAIKLLGGPKGQQRQLAEAVGVSDSAVSQWPETLPPRLADRVIAAAMRKRIAIPKRMSAQ